MNFLKNSHRRYLLIIHLLAILLILNSSKCGCGKEEGLKDDVFGNIIMHVPTDPLIGDVKTTEISFMLADNATIAPLENFTLQVVLQDTSGSISQISYKDSTGTLKETDKVDIPLKSLLEKEHLTTEEPSFTIPFTLVPHPTSKELTAEFKLLNKAESVSEGEVTWRKVDTAVNLLLSRTSAEKIKGDNKIISLKIENKEQEATEKGQLKLKITRTHGNKAFIKGSTQLKNTNVYTIDLPIIAPTNSLLYDLIMDPKEDLQATFSIQLQYKGKDIGTAVIVSWEKGLVIEVKHDRTTDNVKVFVTNTGTETAEKVKLTYDTKTANTTIGNTAKNEKILENLAPNERKEVSDLGKLNFGKDDAGKDNIAAACEFGISCASSCPINPVTTVVKKEVFTRLDIVLSPIVTYDSDKEQFNYTIENAGKDTAKGLQLKYKNISVSEEGKLATLDAKQENTIILGDLESGNKFEGVLAVDFKNAEVAKFNFELQYDNKPMAKLEREAQNKPLNLSLAIISPTRSNAEEYILYGAENELKLKIEQAHNSRTIDINHLALSIKVPAGDGTTVSHIVDGPAITELKGSDLGKIDDIITLYVNPKLEAKEANIRIELYYKGELVGAPVLAQWREYGVFIQSSGRLIGEQIGYFKIIGVSDLDRSAITVSLESEKGATFQFYDKMNGNTEATLADLAEYDTKVSASNRASSEPISFTINEKNGQKESAVKIVIRRKSKVIATHTINWIDKGISVELKTNTILEVEGRPITVNIKNTGDKALKLSEVKVRVKNTENLRFNIGKMAGTTIEGTLEDIIGIKELISKAQIKVYLQPNALLKDKIATGVTLTLFEEKNGKEKILEQRRVIYYIADFYNTQVPIRDMSSEGFSYISKQIVTNKENPGYLAYLLSSLKTGIEVSNKILEKYEQITDTHTEFNEPIRLIRDFMYDRIKKYTILTEETKKAIAELSEQDETIVQWIKDSINKVNNAIEILKGSPEKLKSLNDHKAITKALIGKYDPSKDIDQQTLQGLYEYYQDKSSQIKAFLEKRATTNLPDTPSISQMRALYNRMVSEQSNIQNAVRQTFGAGFEKVNDAIDQEQKELNPATVKRKSQKQVMIFHNKLVKQANILHEWNGLLRKSELVTDPVALQRAMAARYQKLAEVNKNFAKHIYEKNKPGNVTLAAELGELIARETFGMAQRTKNQTIEKVAIETAKAAGETIDTATAAKEATEDAIEAWKLFERARGVRNISSKKPGQSLDMNSNNLNTLPTVLQGMKAQLEILKRHEQEQKKEKKKRGMFGQFFNRSSNNNKVNNNGEGTKDNIDEKDTDKEDTIEKEDHTEEEYTTEENTAEEDTTEEDTTDKGDTTEEEDMNGDGTNEKQES
ncbi:hypothetical protein Aasi_0705 [Candidatus Amoebophilus asiaticus 5a2]|uniref:Uncharacterized protein n=1 Tax=Amoebophilus asiaticus (strain 5a2) TaxID=452471 RepID=B3ES91_AMOA5|nr:hypothetical protein [Candidatus Amoebophilus asiaticus]ACE06093.1 hypothetical protein Aasi_0705 [Candidatus Amoebophilus asiaticus 5a2]